MASGDVTTGSSSTTPNSKLVGPTSDMLLKGLQDAYKGGVKTFDQPLYTPPGATTQNAWAQGIALGDPNSSTNQTLRNKITDDTLTGVGSLFASNGRYGSDIMAKSASEGLGNALAGFDYDNQYRALGTLGQVGASQDADALAKRMAEADYFDKTKNANWNTLGRATSILGGNAQAGGQTTSNSVPWWAALLGGASTGASIIG